MRSLVEASNEKMRFFGTYFKLECPECHEWYIYDTEDENTNTVIYNPKEIKTNFFTIENGKIVSHEGIQIVSSEPFKDFIELTCPICGKKHTFERKELEEESIKCNYFGDTGVKYFILSGKSYEEARKFIEEHNHREEFEKQNKFGFSTLGQQFSYEFIPGGLGYSIVIKCNYCGETKDITDTENW